MAQTLDWSQCGAVERGAEKTGEAWLFRGALVPMTALFESLEDGASIDDFLSRFPGVTREQVAAVLEYEVREKTRQHLARREEPPQYDLNLEHWVCFECRKMFKRPFRIENERAFPNEAPRPYACPQCRETMINMGLYFEPPRQRDIAGWERMRLLADFGHFFYSEGAKADIERRYLGAFPLSVRELRRKLAQERKESAEIFLVRRVRYLKEVKRDNRFWRRK